MCLYPFRDKYIFRKNTRVLQFGCAWICLIMSYLLMKVYVVAYWKTEDWFFCGANRWRSSASIQPKKVHPLDYIFDTCASTSSSNCFNDGEAEHMCLNPFARTQVSSVKKMFCKLGARWHKILEFVQSCPIYGWLAWWCDFFRVGVMPTFEDHPQVFSQKRSSPLDFIFDTCASTSSSHCFNVGEAEHIWLYPFAGTCFFSKKRMFCNLGARWHIFFEFVPDVWPMLIQHYIHYIFISKD